MVLLTVEDVNDRVLAFAFVHHYPDLRYAYLDFIATSPSANRRGLGSALYEALREYLVRKGTHGLFMDVPPGDPKLVGDPARLPANRRRLAFYERFGALPIAGTRYEEHPGIGEPYDPPHLVYDPLGRGLPLPRADARKVVRAILTRKYGWEPEHPYVRMVVQSFRDDPVAFRPRRYVKVETSPLAEHGRLQPLKICVPEHHEIHHVREHGYVERPARVAAILSGLENLPLEVRPVRRAGQEPIRAVHDPDFVDYLDAMTAKLKERETLYPYVFPIRRPEKKPKDRAMRAGYYCIDTFTPLSRTAYQAARAAVDCVVSAAEILRAGERHVYALCRPPGHHAERRVFGGFCYFNNAAIAAHRLSSEGRVALLDIDFHHGNGSQDIFYERDDVLVLSIHGHPNYAYPYFSGFADEKGAGRGLNLNRNYPLPEGAGDDRYLAALEEALGQVRRFRPWALVVSLGFDILEGDPTGAFRVTPKGVARAGEMIGRAGFRCSPSRRAAIPPATCGAGRAPSSPASRAAGTDGRASAPARPSAEPLGVGDPVVARPVEIDDAGFLAEALGGVERPRAGELVLRPGVDEKHPPPQAPHRPLHLPQESPADAAALVARIHDDPVEVVRRVCEGHAPVARVAGQAAVRPAPQQEAVALVPPERGVDQLERGADLLLAEHGHTAEHLLDRITISAAEVPEADGLDRARSG